MRLGGNAHGAARRLGDEIEAHRLEIEQQRVRADVVGAQRLVVEARRIVLRRGEIAAVEHQVAAQLAQAALAQPEQHAPEVLEGQVRVAVALENQLTVEYSLLLIARAVHLGFPAVGGPEQFERGVSGHQLHDRRRIHGAIGIQAERRALGTDRLHDDRDARLGNPGRAQCARDLGGERAAAIGLGGDEGQPAKNHRAGREAQGVEHARDCSGGANPPLEKRSAGQYH